MGENILDPQVARARLAAWKGRVDTLTAETRTMSDRLRALRVSASDPCGLTEVTIDSTGALVDLRLTERIEGAAPAVVAQTIMATIGDARTKLVDRAREIVVDTVGAGSPVARVIADGVDRELGGRSEPRQ